jgi:hypothetical protein
LLGGFRVPGLGVDPDAQSVLASMSNYLGSFSLIPSFRYCKYWTQNCEV